MNSPLAATVATPASVASLGEAAAAGRRCVERRAMLAELAEIGMGLARAIGRRAMAEAEAESVPGDGKADLALGFVRVSRAVRQTLALEARLEQGFEPASAAGASAPPEPEASPGPGAAAMLAKINAFTLQDLIEEAIEAETQDDETVERLCDDLRERLDDEAEAIGEQPIGVMLARICKGLGLAPDWSRWADEPWAIEEAEQRERGSPYGRPNLRPRIPFADDGGAGGESAANAPETPPRKTGPPWH